MCPRSWSGAWPPKRGEAISARVIHAHDGRALRYHHTQKVKVHTHQRSKFKVQIHYAIASSRFVSETQSISNPSLSFHLSISVLLGIPNGSNTFCATSRPATGNFVASNSPSYSVHLHQLASIGFKTKEQYLYERWGLIPISEKTEVSWVERHFFQSCSAWAAYICLSEPQFSIHAKSKLTRLTQNTIYPPWKR